MLVCRSIAELDLSIVVMRTSIIFIERFSLAGQEVRPCSTCRLAYRRSMPYTAAVLPTRARGAAGAPAAARVCGALFLCAGLFGTSQAQDCPDNATGLGDGQTCRCDDGYTGPLSDPDDPTSGSAQL